ncbi:hypothetical protein ANO14919_047840 [Xylariales sp. No.14919]|nr:hypothetical protein ANO14919_047840 [Xylariales sp. No.14919]
MPPQPPPGGAALPPSCRVCGKEKAPASYSKTQLQKWYNKKRNDRRNEITPHTIGLTCKDHASDQREIRCHGPCDRIKLVDHFSKRQRNDPTPWCIVCTEWRLEFDGNEIPTEVPGGRFAPREFDGFDDDESEQHHPPASFDDEDRDEAESSSDDENENPYGEPDPLTALADRLEGYNIEAADEGVTKDATSTMDSVGLSGWDIEYANAGRSDTGSGVSAGTVTNVQPRTTQSRGTLTNASVVSNSGFSTYYPQSYSSTTNNTRTPTEVPPHLRHLASGPTMNHQSQVAGIYRPAQAGQPRDLRDSTSTFSSRFSGARRQPRHMSEGEIQSAAHALMNESSQSRKSNVKKEDARKENSKWYKGDNRRVFPGHKRGLANRVQAGTEAAHDSDSPDEM